MLQREKPSQRGTRNLKAISYRWVLPGLRDSDSQDPTYLTTSSIIYGHSIDFFQKAKLLIIPSKFMSENHCLAYCDLSKWQVGLVTEIAFLGFCWMDIAVWGSERCQKMKAFDRRGRKKKHSGLLNVSLVTWPLFLSLPCFCFLCLSSSPTFCFFCASFLTPRYTERDPLSPSREWEADPAIPE